MLSAVNVKNWSLLFPRVIFEVNPIVLIDSVFVGILSYCVYTFCFRVLMINCLLLTSLLEPYGGIVERSPVSSTTSGLSL